MKKSFFKRHESALNINKGFSEDKKDFKWYEKSVPCRTSCPADTDIPGYLEAIYKKDFDKAYKINLEDNIFPEILGRVCSRPCEDSCRHNDDDNGDSLAICFSKRASGDFKNRRKKFTVKSYSKKTNKKILIIGAGVAGLAASRELKRYGHQVDIFEKHKTPGGMLNQGIPVFRLPRNIINHEIDQILKMGIKIFYNKNINTHEELVSLSKIYDAVILATGTLKTNKINKSFTNNDNVEDGLEFLLRVNEYNQKQIGKNVIVIGGGYTSMDCARTALRLGAKSVKTFYRRKTDDLMILPGELDELVNEKGKMIFNARPHKLIIKKDKLVALELIETKVIKKNGKYKLTDVRGSNFSIKTDHIILAIGQKQELQILSSYRDKLKNAKEKHLITKNIFAAGDYALGATTLIDAIAHAKNTANKVDEFLMKRKILKKNIHIENVITTHRNLELNYVPINKIPTLNFKLRNFNREVELGYNKSNSINEASRCYLCHYKFEINDNLCVLCDECLLVKPVKGCIVETHKTITDDLGDVSYSKVNALKTNGIYHGKLYIDHKKCIRCGECERVCPTNAISIQKVEKKVNAKI